MQFPVLAGIEKRKFIFLIGEEGSILSYFIGKKLSKRLFASWNSSEDKTALERLLASDPKAPVYVLLDLLEQSCIQQSLPAVSSLSIGKLVKKRLERDFPPNDIKGAIPIGREKTGRKDWNYMFVSAHMSPPFSNWMDFLFLQKNRVAGISMLPLEGETLAKTLNKKQSNNAKEKEDAKNKKQKEWQCIVLHNKVSGFRQIVLRQGKLVFTRLIHASENDLPGVVAGNIEQEIVNTLEYLRRLSFQEKSEIDILIFVSADVKSHFEINAIRGHPITVYTPFELAENLRIPSAVYQSDRFTDAVFITNFSHHRPVLRLHSNLTKKLATITWANAWAKAFTVLLIPLILVYLAHSYIEITRMKEVITFAEERRNNLQHIWNGKQEDVQSMQTENNAKINDMVNLYRLLSEGGENPLNVISRFNAAKGPNTLVSSIDWELLESEASKQRQKKPSVSVLFNVELYNKGKSFEELFNTFDSFVHRVETNFPGYKVEFSELPDKLTLNENNKVIPIQVKITGSGR